EGTLVRATGPVPFDHTTVMRTLCDRWSLPSLGARHEAAPSLEPLLARSEPRTDRVTLTPRPYTPMPEPLARLLPPTPHQLDWVKTFAAAVSAPFAREARTVGEVIDHLTSALAAKLTR